MNRLPALSPDTLINKRYLIQQVLGQGGMGRTYLVSDQQCFNQLRVLKEFVPGSTEQYVINKSRELFQREAEVLHKLDHPQIPNFYGHFEEEERIFLLQDFINGKSYRQLLQEHLKQGKTFSETEIIQLFKDLLPVLDYIHQEKIIHRDISPDNIMLPNQEGTVNKPVLIDFGVVKKVEQETIVATQNSGGSLVGKIGYSPIEQIRYGVCYPSSDLYALAVTALVLLTGKDPEELIDNYSLKWQWKKYVSASNNFAEILDKMLEEIPGNRYQSAQEVLANWQKNKLENSANFAFLEFHNPKIAEIGTLAENYLTKKESVTCLMTLRQYGELLAQAVAAKSGIDISSKDDQFSLLKKLEEKGIFQGEVDKLFHQLRKSGNKAVHDRQGDYQTALNCLESAHKLGIWYHQTFVDSNFKPRGFMLPSDLIEEQQNKQEIRKNPDKVAQPLVEVEVKQNKEPAQVKQNKKPPEVKQNKKPPEVKQNKKPPEAKQTLEPAQAKQTLEPAQAKQTLEPAQAKQNLEPAQAKQNLEPAQAKQNLEPAQAKQNLEPAQAKQNLEPAQAKQNLEPAQAKQNLEPAQAKQNLEPAQAKQNLEPAQAKQNLEQTQTKQNLEQTQTKQNLEQTQTKQNKEKQLTEIMTPSLPATQVNIPVYSETQISSSNQNNNEGKQRNPKIFAWAAVAAVILMGGAVVTPHISGVCNTFANCAMEGKYQEKYKKATEKAEAAILEAEVAKTVEEIQASGDRLQSAIQELTEIPQNVKIHQKVQQSLKKYQSKQEQIEERQRKEEEVAEKFTAIEIQSQKVAKATEIAAKIGEIPVKIQEYERVKAGWKQVQQSLLEIPPDVLIREEVEALDKDSQKQVEAIEVELKKLYVW